MRCAGIRRACLAFAGLLSVASAAEGQRQRRFSIDGIVGPSDVRTQRLYDFNNVFATEAVVAFRWRNASGWSPVVAVGGATFYVSDDLACTPVPGGNGDCVPGLPRVSSKSLLGGAEWLAENGSSARLVAGRSSFVVCCRGESSTGPTARIELSTPHTGPVALVGSVSWFRVVNDGEHLQYRSLGFGLRLR